MSCGVCLQDYTKTLRSKLDCTYCQKDACIVCVKRYSLSSMSDPNCMFCKRAFTSELLDLMFTKNFRKNELRRHRIQVLMEQERSLFPHTLTLIEREDAHSAYLTAHEKHVDLIQKISPRETNPVDFKLIEEINNLRILLASLHARVQELGIELSAAKKERKDFIKKCPTCPEGFLSSMWRCHLCKTRACKHCLGIKGTAVPDGEPDPPHECKAEDIESAKAIETSTKPCPYCGVRVQKSEGCNQMWCTSCNNAFDWRTGQKVNGPVHNPHFHEYQQRTNAAPNEAWQNNCENDNDPASWPWIYGSHIVSTINRHFVLNPTLTSKLLDINRLMIERSVSARAYQAYNPSSHEDLRKRRIRKEIDDNKWASLLSARETRRDKENRQKLLDELILAVGRDVIGSMMTSTTLNQRQVEDFIKTLEAGREYYNSQLLQYAAESESKPLFLSDRWVLRF